MFLIDVLAALVELVIWAIVGISKLVSHVFFPEARNADAKKVGNSE